MRAEHKTTYQDIAEALGVDARTVTKWRTKEGFPAEKSIEAVKAWTEKSGFGVPRAIGGATLAELKAELMREQIQLARAKNERERGDVIAVEVVEEMLATLAQKLDLILRLKLEVELGQRVIGKSAAEANVEGAEIVDEIREVINSNIANFDTDIKRGAK